MIEASSYTVDQLLYDGPEAQIYAGTRKSDQSPIFVKQLKRALPTPREVTRLRHDFEMLSRHGGAATPRAYELHSEGDCHALVMERVPGTFLAELIQEGPLQAAEFCRVGIAAAKALSLLFEAHVIHKNLTPYSMLWCEDTESVKILDFGIATTLAKEAPTDISANLIEGTLAYMSPEQTGRMNVSLDFRSDLYSLGVVYYELLTGRLPFLHDDPLALVHAHLAMTPSSPQEISAGVPPVLSEIVMKLLAKHPSQRYQTVIGLLHDLEKVHVALSRGARAAFPLGQGDINPVLQLSERFYGREEPLRELFDGYQEVLDGGKVLSLVAGAPGIGKTCLVNELHKPITRSRGFFVRGKFDQLQYSTPYTAISEAFGHWVRQVLLEPDGARNYRERINEAVAPNGRLLLNIVPELELLIGEQPALTPVEPAQERERLLAALEGLLRAVATRARPLTLFLDDLQWMDPASSKLLQHWLSTPEIRWLFVVGAYRDTEIDESHLLPPLVEHTRRDGTTNIRTLEVGPLRESSTLSWLADTLTTDKKRVEPLSKLLFEKTAGNPFFLRQLVQGLYEDRLLHMDLEQRQWRWRLDAIEHVALSDNVIDLMVSKIANLPVADRQLLQLASIIGNRFDVLTLSHISATEPSELAPQLWRLLETGLILPEDNRYKYIGQGSADVACYFLHDRVQEAAYSMMDEATREKTHLGVGRLLLENTSDTELRAKVFEITNHLNQGRGLITDSEEALALVSLNLTAAEQANPSGAFGVAEAQVGHALDLLGEGAWDTHYDQSLALYRALTVSQLAQLKYSALLETINIAKRSTRTAVDRHHFYSAEIDAYISQHEYSKATDAARECLAELGLRMPKRPRLYHSVPPLLRIRWHMRSRSVADLAQLPQCDDPRVRALVRILHITFLPSTYVDPLYLPWISFWCTQLAIEFGLTPEAPHSFTLYATLLANDETDVEGAVQFSELALGLVDRVPDHHSRVLVELLYLFYARHLHSSNSTLADELLQNYRLGTKQANDKFFQGLSLVAATFERVVNQDLASRLASVEDELDRHHHLVERFNFSDYSTFEKCVRDWVRRLRGKDPLPAHYVLQEEVDLCETSFELLVYLHLRALEAYTFNAPDQCCEAVEAQTAHVPKFDGNILLCYVLYPLARLELYPRASRRQRRKTLRIVRQNLRRLEKRMALYRGNYEHWSLVLQAERARVLGRALEAQRLFAEAIEKARESDSIFAYATTLEVSAKFYLSIDNADIAAFSMRRALEAYQGWGAHGKVRQLRALYPELCGHLDGAAQTAWPSPVAVGSAAFATNLAANSATLDLATITRANQTLSSEMNLERLLEKMLLISLENVGAESAMYLEKSAADWQVVATMQKSSTRPRFELYDTPTPDRLSPGSLIDYTERMREPLVLSDAAQDERFENDPYVQERKVRSTLCMPIVHHDKLNSMLYLENNLMAGAFTSDRVEVLSSLAAQIAISLENARHMQQLARVHERTERFVPKQFLELILKESVEDIELGDSMEHEISVLFNDIRDFTAHVEKKTPDEAFTFVNRYWELMAPAIRRHGGYIDQFQGDSVMAIFPRSPDDAVQAGQEMLDSLRAFNDRQVDLGELAVDVGIGVASGRAMLGIIGEDERLGSGVISDVTNTASRVESLNKVYGTRFLVGGSAVQVLERPDRVPLRQIDRVILKGRSAPTLVYEVIDWQNDLRDDQLDGYLDEFRSAFLLYERGAFAEAVEIWTRCADRHSGDKVVRVLLDRCREFLLQGAPPRWDGSFRLDRK